MHSDKMPEQSKRDADLQKFIIASCKKEGFMNVQPECVDKLAETFIGVVEQIIQDAKEIAQKGKQNQMSYGAGLNAFLSDSKEVGFDDAVLAIKRTDSNFSDLVDYTEVRYSYSLLFISNILFR